MGISFLPPFLQSLCYNSPWNYAVFWKPKHQDETLLAWEDGFCDILKPRNAMARPIEDFYFNSSNIISSSFLTPHLDNGTPRHCLVRLAVAEMSSASHVVGEGVVGRAALTGNARWTYSDSIETDVLSSILVSEQYPDEWLLQFAAGIKTILLLPVIPDGVLQLGSVEMVAEDAEFIAYVKNEFDAYKETHGHDRRYSIEQFSPVSTFMNNFEEPSTVNSEQVIEDQNSIHAVKLNDRNLYANQIVPVFMFQDFHNTSESCIADTPENMAESVFSQQLMGRIHVAEPCPLSSEDSENEIFKYYLEQKLSPSSHSDELDSRMCGDFMNSVIDLHFEEGLTEPSLVGNNFDSAICEDASKIFGFPTDYELPKTLAQDKSYEYTFGTSIPGQDDGGPSYAMDVQGVEVEQLLETAVADAYSRFDCNSSGKSNVTSVNTSSGNLLSSKSRCQSKCSVSVNEERIPSNFFTSEFIAPGLDTKSTFSASVSSVESKISSLCDKRRQRKGFTSLDHGKFPRLSTTNKRKGHTGNNQRPRPRDRQLIQDRMKELRELVPNSEKCSIDGLLDKTIKHMLFLRSVTNQADKLRHPILKEGAPEKAPQTAEINSRHQSGTSWAVELGSEQQFSPIIVKDLDLPGHILIEMHCTDHGRFLEISDAIRRLQLTILKGGMEKTPNNSLARFIVQTSGSFHRLDIFWPLMQLLQQNRSPISSKIQA